MPPSPLTGSDFARQVQLSLSDVYYLVLHSKQNVYCVRSMEQMLLICYLV